MDTITERGVAHKRHLVLTLDASMDTPCIAVCFIDPATGLCAGCGRTMPEIAGWHRFDRDARLAIMGALPQRMADAGMPILSRKGPKR